MIPAELGEMNQSLQRRWGCSEGSNVGMLLVLLVIFDASFVDMNRVVSRLE